MDALIFCLSFAAIAFVAVLLFRSIDERLTLGFGLLFALYLGLDDLATSLPSISRVFQLFGGDWNWSGKIYSVVLAVVVALVLGIRREAIGATLAQRNIKASWIALAILTAVGFALGLVFKPSNLNAETIAFQALMPGLAEELAYRGVAPALLLGLIHRKNAPRGIPWAVVGVTALMFGIWHGLSYSDGSFAFQWVPALYTLIGGVAYGWLRFNSGSLLFPFLAHGFGNVVFELTALLRM
jgi:uncharacterized protein